MELSPGESPDGQLLHASFASISPNVAPQSSVALTDITLTHSHHDCNNAADAVSYPSPHTPPSITTASSSSSTVHTQTVLSPSSSVGPRREDGAAHPVVSTIAGSSPGDGGLQGIGHLSPTAAGEIGDDCDSGVSGTPSSSSSSSSSSPTGAGPAPQPPVLRPGSAFLRSLGLLPTSPQLADVHGPDVRRRASRLQRQANRKDGAPDRTSPSSPVLPDVAIAAAILPRDDGVSCPSPHTHPTHTITLSTSSTVHMQAGENVNDSDSGVAGTPSSSPSSSPGPGPAPELRPGSAFLRQSALLRAQRSMPISTSVT